MESIFGFLLGTTLSVIWIHIGKRLGLSVIQLTALLIVVGLAFIVLADVLPGWFIGIVGGVTGAVYVLVELQIAKAAAQ